MGMRVPISGVYKIKGVGDVLAGRVEQGEVKVGEDVVFLPTHTASNPCFGKVFSIEMHHKRVEQAAPGDNVGMNIKGLDKKKLESPHSLKSNEVALVTFEPQQPMIVDSFKSCEGLSRIAFLDGNTAVMLGKVTKTYPL